MEVVEYEKLLAGRRKEAIRTGSVRRAGTEHAALVREARSPRGQKILRTFPAQAELFGAFRRHLASMQSGERPQVRILRLRLDGVTALCASDDRSHRRALPNAFELLFRLQTSAGPLIESARFSPTLNTGKAEWECSTARLDANGAADLARSRQQQVLVLTVATAEIARRVLAKIRADVLHVEVRDHEAQSREAALLLYGALHGDEDGGDSITVPTPTEAARIRRLAARLAPVRTIFTTAADGPLQALRSNR